MFSMLICRETDLQKHTERERRGFGQGVPIAKGCHFPVTQPQLYFLFHSPLNLSYSSLTFYLKPHVYRTATLQYFQYDLIGLSMILYNRYNSTKPELTY